MNQIETKKKKKGKGRGADIGAGRGTGMGKRLRDCSDAGHEKGVREGRRQIDRSLAHAHTSSTSSVFKNLATGSAAEEFFK